METQIEFLNDVQIKVTTKQGTEVLGHLTLCPAQTDKQKQEVIDVVKQAFDRYDTLVEVRNMISLIGLTPLTSGLMFEYLVTPQEANRKRIGKRIKEIRESKNLSARQLAFMTHIDPPNLSRIESGKHSVSIDTLNKIAYFLDAEIQIVVKDNKHGIPPLKMYDGWE